MSTTGPLDGKVALVTGGNRGLGRGMALALAEAGADVALGARDQASLDAVADEVRALGRRALAVSTDVTSSAAVDALVAGAVEQLGGLDVLVNNSGVLHPQPLIETSDEDWDRVIATNVRGNFLCCRAAGRVFKQRGAGKVINIASNFAYMGVPGFVSYCSSKAAVVAFTRALAVEWAPLNVQVNAIAPGYFESDMNAELRADEELLKRTLRQIPQRRMGQPQELGPLVVYLASAASDFMTGETLLLDGGQAAR
ncbi:MAG TPA: 3-oxoacyl-ACP reductase family protein [Solirubrobacterales bacterium]